MNTNPKLSKKQRKGLEFRKKKQLESTAPDIPAQDESDTTVLVKRKRADDELEVATAPSVKKPKPNKVPTDSSQKSLRYILFVGESRVF